MNASIRNLLREAGNLDKDLAKRRKNVQTAFSQLKVRREGGGAGYQNENKNKKNVK